MTLRKLTVIGITALATLALLGAFSIAPAATAAPQQAMQCRWQNIGSSGSTNFHIASAIDTDANKALVYGGVDESLSTVNKVEEVDLSGTNLSATTRNVSAGSARRLMGAAGAYRAKGDMADGSAFYFFGGIDNPTDGDATGDVQSFTTKTSTWAVESGLSLTDRVFAAAAYDPEHDVIWIVGGTSQCSLTDVVAGQSCNVQNRPVQYLSFDPGTGAPKMNTLSGASFNYYGHSMVYDSAGKRMLIFGGTNDIRRAVGNVVALDLTDPDVTKAKLGPLSTSGTSPSVFFHGASYDATNNWMVVYGGVKQNFMQSNESVDTVTWALDLGATPNPMWVNLGPQGTPGDRVAGGTFYDPKHMATIEVLGRKKISFSGGNPSPSAQRPIYGLTCVELAPTNTPPPTNTTDPTLPTAPPKPTTGAWEPPPPDPQVCPNLANQVPQVVIDDAMANQTNVQGWMQLCNNNLPPSPWNKYRDKLSLQSPSKPYNALFNGVVWKCGCP